MKRYNAARLKAEVDWLKAEVDWAWYRLINKGFCMTCDRPLRRWERWHNHHLIWGGPW